MSDISRPILKALCSCGRWPGRAGNCLKTISEDKENRERGTLEDGALRGKRK